MIDPRAWFTALQRSAHALDHWHREGKQGARPPGHLRAHVKEHVRVSEHGLVHWVHTHILDPDGRPAHLKRTSTY
jgi:hypothetical protein